jgi:hypothetical protein
VEGRRILRHRGRGDLGVSEGQEDLQVRIGRYRRLIKVAITDARSSGRRIFP